MRAAHTYMKTQPQGRWRGEVRAWLSEAERRYLWAAGHDRKALRALLSASPEGPHADLARARLALLSEERALHDAEQRDFEFGARVTFAELDRAAEARRGVLMDLRGWLALLARIERWHGRTHELPHDFIYEYRLEEPAARCGPTQCRKSLAIEYAIPENKRSSGRVAIYDVILDLDGGGVVGATLTGPQLFDRLAECMDLAPVAVTHTQSRVEAIGRAAQLITAAVEAAMPAAECARQPVGQVIVERACRGRRLRAIAAVGESDEDRVVVEPWAEGSELPSQALRPALSAHPPPASP